MSTFGDFRELVVKSVGKPDARNGHVRFDERGRETTGCHSVPVPRPSSTLPGSASKQRTEENAQTGSYWARRQAPGNLAGGALLRTGDLGRFSAAALALRFDLKISASHPGAHGREHHVSRIEEPNRRTDLYGRV